MSLSRPDADFIKDRRQRGARFVHPSPSQWSGYIFCLNKMSKEMGNQNANGVLEEH